MVHRSAVKGKVVDMDRLRNANATKVAVGNANLNARGDLIGHGGRILKTREQMLSEYNQKNSKAVKHVSISDKTPLPEHFETPQQIYERMKQEQMKAEQAKKQAVQEEPQPNMMTIQGLVDGEYRPIQVPSMKIGEESGAPKSKPVKRRIIDSDKI